MTNVTLKPNIYIYINIPSNIVSMFEINTLCYACVNLSAIYSVTLRVHLGTFRNFMAGGGRVKILSVCVCVFGGVSANFVHHDM